MPKPKISLEEIRQIPGALATAQALYPRNAYIGGTTEQARERYWNQDPEMTIITDSIANEYGINPYLLRARLDAEGFTDRRIKASNKFRKDPNSQDANYGARYANSQAFAGDAANMYGLDDMGTYIKNGQAQLINENWGDGEFINEKGRKTNLAVGNTQKDNIGIMAAGLKMFRDKAKQDFPKTSEEDLDRYASAYYNRGPAGGKKWVLSGAKGYNIKRSLQKGGNNE